MLLTLSLHTIEFEGGPMCRKVQGTFAALVAGLLFSSAQAAAAAITSTSYSEQALAVKSSSAQNAPAEQGATLAMAGGAILILFGSIRRKNVRR